jgi:hypothetical protein
LPPTAAGASPQARALKGLCPHPLCNSQTYFFARYFARAGQMGVPQYHLCPNQAHSTSPWEAKFQLLEVSNLSSSNWNLVVHIPSGAATAPPLTGRGRSCASSFRVPKKNARCPGRAALCRKAWAGWLSYVPCPREGQEEEQNTSSAVSARGPCPSGTTTDPLGQMFIFHGTSDVANRNHRSWST